ncbi:iron-sulfur cluster assembly scaffold protein [Candidatus Pelagibacter bacterium]|jgi:nitrogen fixation NifU-like protein|nr:iron-sulfur cluster assembly scaffold protein [Candidatus Pelagibacter bacterium]
MINKEIIKIASNTSNVGLNNKYSHKISLKNKLCGDKITLELIVTRKKIISMKYETESCIYCEASASLLSKKIKKLNILTIKNDFINLKKILKNSELKIPKKFADFKKLFNSDNFNRYNCLFLPFDAVIKALKL